MGSLLIFKTHQSTTVKESISILKLRLVERCPGSHSVSMRRCLMAYFSFGVNLSIVCFDWHDSKLILFLLLILFEVSKDI